MDIDDDFIDYGQLIDEAMHIIVKKALQRISKEGLPGKHHFFISFVTDFPGVELSDAMRNKYPDEMTVVLQHQFDDLKVYDDKFSVALSFDNVREKITIPFDSLVAFADPSVKFGLQFRHVDEFEAEIDEEFSVMDEFTAEDDLIDEIIDKKNKAAKKGGAKKKKSTKKDGNVVDIDSFRKK